MKKRTFRFTLLSFVCIGLTAGVFVAGQLTSNAHFHAAHEDVKICGGVTFGSTKTSSSTRLAVDQALSDELYPSEGGLSNLVITPKTNYIYSNGTAGEAIKLGSGSGIGTLELSFDAIVIHNVYIYASCSSSKATSANLSVSTSGHDGAVTYTVNNASTYSPDLTNIAEAFSTSEFLNDSNPSTSITISTTAADSKAAIQLFKIVVAYSDSCYSSESDIADTISFHFLEVGNEYTGDCTYIRAGDNDILIDAGSRAGSAATINSYLENSSRGEGNYVSDNKLEYVIATHAHQDHISGMYGVKDSKETAGKNGILYHYDVDNLIDFSYYDNGSVFIDNKDPNNEKGSTTFSDSSAATTIYRNYLTARSYAVSNGTNWKTAGELSSNGNNYTVSLGQGLTMTVLYNFFYDHITTDIAQLESTYAVTNVSAQNDNSVCLLFAQQFKSGTKYFLLTGDAETYAEHSIVKYNELPHVNLFKAGHHGSYTASSAELMAAISPEKVCVCCCAGSTEYTTNTRHTFPAQEFIDRVAPYTDEVYVTTIADETDTYKSFNGDIVATYAGSKGESIQGSNSNTKLKDSEWFAANRTCPEAWK